MTFEIPDFSAEAKEMLQKQHKLSPLLTVKALVDSHNISHQSAKFMAQHITKNYNYCNRCNTGLNSQEYTTCRKCGALNFNWK
jgi:ribosomal protein L40E